MLETVLGLVPRGLPSLTLRQASLSSLADPAQTRLLFGELARYAGPSGVPPPQRYLELLQRYGRNAWVYAAAHRKAADQAAIPLKIMQAGGDEVVEVENTHPLRLLLDRVNSFSTFYDLIEINSLNLDLSGNDYWLIFGGRDRVPVEIWPLRPDWVSVVPDAERFIRGYIVRPEGGDPHPFLPISQSEDGTGILHFKHANPWNLWYGQGALAAAWTSVLTDEAATQYRYFFYKNSARPDGVLSTNQKLTDTGVQQIREWWAQTFQGPSNAHRTAILDSDLKYQSISISPKDSDVSKDRELSRPDMLVAFGVSLAVLGVETGDVGRRDEQIRHYYRSTIKPAVMKRAGILTEFLAPRFGDDLTVVPDFSGVKELQDDEFTRAQIDEIELRSAVTIVNEVRARKGLAPVAWGAKPLLSVTMAPLGEGGFGFGSPPIPPKSRRVPVLVRIDGEDLRGDLWLEAMEKAGRLEVSFRETLARALAAAGELLRQRVAEGRPAEAAVAEMEGVIRASLRRIAEEQLPEFLEAGWDWAVRQIRVALRRERARKQGTLELLFDLAIPQLAVYLSGRPLVYGDLVATSLATEFRALLADQANAGASIEQMAQAVSEQFDALTVTRARVIARTEVIAASNLGTMTAYQESGVVDAQEWLTARDERVRPSHQAADEQTQLLGQPFQVGGAALRFPGDPQGPPQEVIQCRCVTLPVLTGEL